MSTIGTIPAGSLLRISVSLILPPQLPFALPGYAPDVVFSYQATAAG
jgi:hypothetical protein